MTSKEILVMKFPKLEEAKIDFIIGKVENHIKEYCNRDDVPEALNYTIVDIASQFISMYGWSDGSVITAPSVDGPGEIASIKEGDTTITYNVAEKGAVKSFSTEEDVYFEFAAKLNKYRKLRR